MMDRMPKKGDLLRFGSAGLGLVLTDLKHDGHGWYQFDWLSLVSNRTFEESSSAEIIKRGFTLVAEVDSE